MSFLGVCAWKARRGRARRPDCWGSASPGSTAGVRRPTRGQCVKFW